jgi:hypothetical protein
MWGHISALQGSGVEAIAAIDASTIFVTGAGSASAAEIASALSPASGLEMPRTVFRRACVWPLAEIVSAEAMESCGSELG